jgi:CRP-like cAMP-binding protein
MEPKYYNKGEYVCKIKEVGDTLIIIEKGEIDIKTEMEGNEFMIDRLIPGTVINFRTFLLDDLMDVDMVCVSGCKII